MTNKQTVIHAEPKAILDYYELLRGQGKPCWFIRCGPQGRLLSAICASPKAAWKDAADALRARRERLRAE
jgi:hypothetical protein